MSKTPGLLPDRRRLLRLAFAGVAATGLVALDPRRACALGREGPEELPRMLERAAGVDEGRGSSRIFVLFSITCPYSRRMHAALRPYMDRVRLRWVPIGEADRIAAAEASLVQIGTPAALATALDRGTAADGAETAGSRMTIRMHRVFLRDRLVPLVKRHTGRPMASPTFVYRRTDGSVRIVRGAVPDDLVAAMIDDAF